MTEIKKKTIKPFEIKDCVLVPISTGKRAQNLRELRDNLLTIPLESIYYHFWGWRLMNRFDVSEFNNDFATWAYRHLRDHCLAERLSVIDPTDFKNLEDLRIELIEVIEERLAEGEHVPWSKFDSQFYFTRSQIVVFDTHKIINKPKNLVDIIPKITEGTVFYHFIDARRRTYGGKDDFFEWLSGFGKTYKRVCKKLELIDPYFDSLLELREKISNVMVASFKEKNKK